MEELVYDEPISKNPEKIDENAMENSFYMGLHVQDLQGYSLQDYASASPQRISENKHLSSLSSHAMDDSLQHSHKSTINTRKEDTHTTEDFMDFATEILSEVKGLKCQKEATEKSRKKRARNTLICCLVILSNILATAALCVAATWIVFWVFEIREYTSKVEEVEALLKQLITQFDTSSPGK